MSVVLVWVVVTLIFFFLRAIPGDPIETMMSQSGTGPPPPAAVATMRRDLGLNRPVGVQYVVYLDDLVHLNLGTSYISGRAVASDVAQRLPRTLELILASTIIGLPIGLGLGVLAGVRHGGALDVVVSFAASTGISVPVFVLGTVLVLIFSEYLGLVPAGAYVDLTTNPAQNLEEVLLPAISLAYPLMAVITRMTRSAVLEVMRQDWVRTARSKGAPRSRVVIRHVLRNALNPVVTVLGLQMGTLLGGTVLVEYVFNWPGLSSLLVQSAEQRDYPEVQGIVLVIAVLFIFLNLAVDLLYSALDPRIRRD